MRTIRIPLAILVAVSFFAALPLSVRGQQKTLTIGLTTRTGSNSLPFVIAEEKGLFKAEGVNAIIVVMQNQVVVTGVASKNVDYGGTFSNFVGAALAGLPVKIVMSVMDGSDHVLVTAPSIKRVEDLKGKIVGISSFGGTPHSEVLTILKKHGMSEKEVTFLQIGGSTARYQSLEIGNIQAAMLLPPFNKMARQKGFNEIIAFNDVLKIPLGGLSTHVDKLREGSAEIVKMVRALIKSVDYIYNRKPEILSLMEKSWGIKDPEVREAMYRDIVPLYSRNGIAPDDVMKNVIQLVQEGRKAKPNATISDVADWSFAKKAGEELKR
jgi:NitT/TauT family transport system substrate-binding protein